MIGLSIALLVSLGFNTMPEPTHICHSRELQAHCFSLSSTEKTCYTLPNKTGGKRCTEGWDEIIQIQDEVKEEESIGIKLRQWSCDSDKCSPII